jgi:hypothetical protein
MYSIAHVANRINFSILFYLGGLLTCFAEENIPLDRKIIFKREMPNQLNKRLA